MPGSEFLKSAASVPPSVPMAAFAGMAAIAFLTDLFITGDGFAFPDTVHTELAPAPAASTGLRQEVDATLAPDFRWCGSLTFRTRAQGAPQHLLYFLPLPHGHRAFLPTLGVGGLKSISSSDGVRKENVVLPR